MRVQSDQVSPGYRSAHPGYIPDRMDVYITQRNRFPKHGTISTQLYSGRDLFFTVTLADRRSKALVENIGTLRSAFRAARRTRPFAIDAIVILPDHLHAILTLPSNDADFSGRWRRIKGNFSNALIEAGVRLRRHSNGDLALWQRRFWEHTIRDDSDFARHVDYIHFNPVKHGLVHRARDWPYSSFHRYVRVGLMTDDWAGDVSEVGTNLGEPAG